MIILPFSRESNQGNLSGVCWVLSRKPLCGKERLGLVGATNDHAPGFLLGHLWRGGQL